jgi:hypothetical protein
MGSVAGVTIFRWATSNFARLGRPSCQSGKFSPRAGDGVPVDDDGVCLLMRRQKLSKFSDTLCYVVLLSKKFGKPTCRVTKFEQHI